MIAGLMLHRTTETFLLKFALPERWPSGRRRTPGKCVYGKTYRGFESLSLRHIYNASQPGWFGTAKPLQPKSSRNSFAQCLSMNTHRFLDSLMVDLYSEEFA